MAFKTTPLAFFFVFFLLAIKVADATIGVNWGRQNAQRLLPSNVVDLLLQNGIQEARLFTSEEDMLRAFHGSGIRLTVTIADTRVINKEETSRKWVESKQNYFNSSNIRHINVADYSFAAGVYNKAIVNEAMTAMLCLHNALNDAGYGDQIKVTIPQNHGVLKMNRTSFRPSEAEFRDEIKQEMATFLRFLKQNNAPFVVVVNTIGLVDEFGINDLNFAIPDNKSTFVVEDVNGAVYTNLFELMYDTYIWALIKLNASDIKVIVGQTGWPTDGYIGANTTMAERFFKGLLPWVTSNKGTPMRRGAPIDIFIHSLTDENRMSFFYAATFTRHFGIYRSNGKPKYKIDLSGQGRDIYPSEAKGIMRMPKRWCLFNGNRSDIEKVLTQLNKACAIADCTTLAPGGSCSHLGFDQNISYAFNMHFQFQYQNETECDFDGLGVVSAEDPSTPGCVFPVEVVRAQQRTSSYAVSERANCAMFVFLLSILGTLFWN